MWPLLEYRPRHSTDFAAYHRLTAATQRNTYTHHSSTPSPAPILYPNAHASSSLSGRGSPFPRPASSNEHHPSPYLYTNGNGNGNASGRSTPLGNGGSQYSESPYGSSANLKGGYSRTAHEVERQNDDKLEGLLGKVKILKDVGQALDVCESQASNGRCSGRSDYNRHRRGSTAVEYGTRRNGTSPITRLDTPIQFEADNTRHSHRTTPSPPPPTSSAAPSSA